MNCEYGHISDDHPFIACHNPESPDRENGGCLLPDHTCAAWTKRVDDIESFHQQKMTLEK